MSEWDVVRVIEWDVVRVSEWDVVRVSVCKLSWIAAFSSVVCVYGCRNELAQP